jgi:hypothetical protein
MGIKEGQLAINRAGIAPSDVLPNLIADAPGPAR